MASQQTYTDEEVRVLELRSKLKSKGLSDSEFAELEQLSKPKPAPEPPRAILPESQGTRALAGKNELPGKWMYGGKLYLPDGKEPEKLTIKDAAQAVGSAATGLAAFPISTAVSAGLMLPRHGALPLPPEVAEMVGQKVGGAMTIKPTTPAAQEATEALVTPFWPFGKAIEAMPTPETRTALSVAMLLLPYAKGLAKGFLRGRVESGKGITPKEVEAVLGKTPDVPADVAARARSTRMQDPPTPTGRPVEDAIALEKFNAAQRAREAALPPDVGAFPKPDKPPIATAEKGPIKTAPITGINQNPAQILADALKQAPRILPAQKASYVREVGEKFARAEEAAGQVTGEARVQAARGQMKGELTKLDFDVPAIPAEARNSLFDMIWDNKFLKIGEKLSVSGEHPSPGRGPRGLIGMLDHGKFPAKFEVELMTRVFGPEVGEALLGRLSPKEQLMFWGTQLANVPRTLMASFDLSAPLRQGVWLIGKPKQFGAAFLDMFKALKSEEGYNASVRMMANKPTFNLARESGLALTEIGSAIGRTEEGFLGAGMLERIGRAATKKWPDVRGKAVNFALAEGVKASQRAYTGFLNKLRFDTFDHMVNTAKELGLYNLPKTNTPNIYSNPKLSTDIARYVNIASGRGNLKGIAQEHAALTNAVFFSPRLMSARIALFDPRTYVTIPKFTRRILESKGFLEKGSEPRVSAFVRQEAIMDAAKFMSFYTTSAVLAKFVLGQDLGVDTRSADFTKILSGNTSVDLSGGIGSYARLASTMAQPLFEKLGIVDEAYTVSSVSGKKTKMGGGFNEESVLDAITRFLSQKENPVVSFFMDTLGQKERDFSGEPYSVKKEIGERLVPILAQDLWELYKDDPNGLKMAVMGLLALFGAGVSTYPPRVDPSFVEPEVKTRADIRQSQRPSGDPIVDELRSHGVKATVGKKTIAGEPIPPEDVAELVKEGGETMRRTISFYINNPAYAKATDEQKKKWLQKAVDTGWRIIKKQKEMERLKK